MNYKQIDAQRRRALFTVAAAVASAPFVKYLGQPVAAADLAQLQMDEPAAKALKYHIDATTAPREDKPGGKAAEQFCYNCRFVQAESGEWRPCQLFPGKAVNENGWCSGWMPKGS